MEINEAIEKERVIEIGIKRPDNYDSVYYSGVCLKATKNIWMIINYNIDINTFDGFTVFRNTDVEAYSVFIKKDLPKADKKQFNDLKTAVHIGRFNTIYSSLKSATNFGLVAIFVKGMYDAYFVIKVISVSKNEVEFWKVDKDGKLSKKKETILLDNIIYLSFFTKYEKKLLKLIGKSK